MLFYILYIIISPILSLSLYIVGLFNYKIRTNHFFFYSKLYKIKQKINDLSKGKSIILFHAASAGEYEQLKPILRLIDKDKYFIIQSFTSPTIFKQVKSISSLSDIICYHPYDFLWRSWLFFKILNPNKYVITRHDLWPGHIAIAKFLNIKTYFINANIHKNSIWYKSYFRLLTKWTFHKLNAIIVPSQSIKNNLLIMNINSSLIKVIKDTRFDQILYRSIHRIPKLKLPKIFIDSEVIIFGSIDFNDEQIIFQAFQKLFSSGSQTLQSLSKALIIVPHENDSKTIKRITSQLTNQHFQYILSSNMNLKEKLNNNVIVINEIGLLAELYKYAKIAYVGGGFSKGVHSILEPAIYNCALVSGPNIEMLDEAKELVKDNHLTIVKDSNMLYNYLSKNTSNTITTSSLFNTAHSSERIVRLLTCS